MYRFNHLWMQSWNPYVSNMNMNSYIRILHASPGAPPVDVYVNNNPIIRGIKYKDISKYLPVMQGVYNVKVYPAGQQMNPVINTNITVEPMTAYTIAATDQLPNISLMPIVDPYNHQNNKNIAYVRFAHLSPNAPAVDITLPDGTKLFSDVEYTEYTEYIEVSPGIYTLQVRPAGSKDVVLTIPNVQLNAGLYQTIYAIGLIGGNPPLEAVAFIDG